MTTYLDFHNLPPEFELFTFPGGEPHCNIPKIADTRVLLRFGYTNWEDFGSLMVMLNALAAQGLQIDLFMPYFPGARQDRNPEGLTPLTVQVFARMIQPYIHRLITFDVHSEQSMRLLSNYVQCHYYHPFDLDSSLLPQDIDFIIAPDKGAVSRASMMKTCHYPKAELIICDKKRTFETGKFERYDMPPLVEAGRYLVVDDICDGGGTFMLLAGEFWNDSVIMQERKISELFLYVSHGIFSKGFEELLTMYNHIYTTDSRDFFYMDHEDDVTVIPLEQFIPGIMRLP